MPAVTPIDLLRSFHQLYEEHGTAVPEHGALAESWQAVAFIVNGQRMLVRLDRVSEVLPKPAVTRLPGVKSWVRGIANVRGVVLPIVDFGEYLGQSASRQSAQSRVVAIERGDIRFGLIVDQVIGMRQVITSQQKSEASNTACADFMQGYVEGSVVLGDEEWNLFSPEKLVEKNEFLEVSVL